jgi:hypothetical protein
MFTVQNLRQPWLRDRLRLPVRVFVLVLVPPPEWP